jgi:hypothetical protein
MNHSTLDIFFLVYPNNTSNAHQLRIFLRNTMVSRLNPQPKRGPRGGRIRNLPTTTGVNPRPTCLLCGIEIPHLDSPGIANSPKPELFKKGRWENYWSRSPKHVLVPSSELEDAYLSDFPRLGSCFCRASEFGDLDI